MCRKQTLEYVREKFKERGYKLLSGEYINNRVKLDYTCPRHHRGSICWADFQTGYGCPECAGHKRITLVFVKKQFAKEKYKVLSDTCTKASQPISFLCPNNHEGKMSWSNFQQGHRCAACNGNQKHTIEYARQQFAKEGYSLLSKQYIGAHSKLDYKCPKGHLGKVEWVSFLRGTRCAKCSIQMTKLKKIQTLLNKRGIKCDASDAQQVFFEYIKQCYQKIGYQLLSSYYKNCFEKLEVKCNKGHTYQATWNNFYNLQQRCPVCHELRHEKLLGEMLEQLYPRQVVRQSNLTFLGKLRADFAVPTLNLAFEYDGEHHFRPVRYGGMSLERAKKCFIKQQERDRQKEQLCKKNGYRLIHIAYYENLYIENIKQKIHGGST